MIDEILEPMDRGDLELARQRLLASAADARGEEALRVAELAQRLGLAAAAMRCCQQVLRDAPDHPQARELLATLYEERGDLDRAVAVRSPDERISLGSHGRKHLETTGPLSTATAPLPGASPGLEAPADDAPASVSPAEGAQPAPGPAEDGLGATAGGPPTTADLVRFLERFAGRPDVHARMRYDRNRGVGYSPLRHPLTLDVLRAHLDGALTAGIYLVSPDDTVRLVVFDVDASKAALERAAGDPQRVGALKAAVRGEAMRLLAVLRRLGLDPVLEDSGYKGCHLWLFLPEPVAAGRAVRFGRAVLASTAPRPEGVRVELFPKQEALAEGGLGNLVKLPLGIHLRSGRRADLLDDEGGVHPDPFGRIRSARRVELPELEIVEEPPATPAPAQPLPPLPDQAPRPFTASRFETSPWLGPVLSGCHVLRAVVEDVLLRRELAAEAPQVLNHTLGHLPDGVEACNYLYAQVGGVADAARMVTRHKGQPTGCGKVRGRLPGVVARVSCSCSFPPRPGEHAHPLRHLDGVVLTEAKATGLDDLVLAYTRQLHVLGKAQAEADALRVAVIEGLQAVPGRRWAAPGGEWVVGGEGGVPVLLFEQEESAPRT